MCMLHARSGRAGPSRRAASSRKSRLTDSFSGSPTTRGATLAAHAAPGAAVKSLDLACKQAGGKGDALHPVIVIKGLDGTGAEACQPKTHPAVSRLKDGETGSSTSQGALAEAARGEQSEGASMADTFPAQQYLQEQHAGTQPSAASPPIPAPGFSEVNCSLKLPTLLLTADDCGGCHRPDAACCT